MGPGDTDLLNDMGAGADAVACSICLDAVTGGADRSTARLQCGHEFHLDCIGSAFNAKGVMQCPNCRKVEKGNWLYSNGSCSVPELSMHESSFEDLYDHNYSEMPFGVHWCPFSRYAQYTTFEDGESSLEISIQDLLGRHDIHHAIFTEHPTSATHPSPYMAYDSSSSVFSEGHIDGPAFHHHHWNHVPGTADVQIPIALHANDHYHSWEHHSPTYSIRGGRTSGDQASVSSATMRVARLDSDGRQRAGSLVHPFILGNQSRAAGSFVSTSIPPYLSNSGSQVNANQHYEHQNSRGMHGTVFSSGAQRPGRTRGSASVGPAPLAPPNHTGLYYLFPPTQSSGLGLQDADNPEGNRFYSWERDNFPPFPLPRVDREPGWRGPFLQPQRSSDSGGRMGFRQQHGSETLSSQGRLEGSSYRPIHAPPHW